MFNWFNIKSKPALGYTTFGKLDPGNWMEGKTADTVAFQPPAEFQGIYVRNTKNNSKQGQSQMLFLRKSGTV